MNKQTIKSRVTYSPPPNANESMSPLIKKWFSPLQRKT